MGIQMMAANSNWICDGRNWFAKNRTIVSKRIAIHRESFLLARCVCLTSLRTTDESEDLKRSRNNLQSSKNKCAASTRLDRFEEIGGLKPKSIFSSWWLPCDLVMRLARLLSNIQNYTNSTNLIAFRWTNGHDAERKKPSPATSLSVINVHQKLHPQYLIQGK